MTHFAETSYGFEWGAAKVTRACSDHGWIMLDIATPRERLGIYVTRAGKVRIYTYEGNRPVAEWKNPLPTKAAKRKRARA